MSIPCFFASVVGGFVLMAVVGVRALIALFSSIPLAKRRHQKNPEFDLKKARHRIMQIVVLGSILVAIITVLMIVYAPISATIGYLVGMICAFVASIKRMSPNNAKNQTSFTEIYADCYPPGDISSDKPEDTIVLKPKSATKDDSFSDQ